ncbi:antibiotic biosynthesis monooxygenase [Paraneptunicella aestuarii]|uniref:antibiotic biosynthesis monooxygenase family protein n=1 Tax=Paraneptunicella aestuarii TaxID=2831148 RepID=UPI001E44E047|nr:antibiotic biosynthesis monooxygenase [Paraneptunicella aestuarii]UAA38403.1 antibiotic biosynthesis monooxygenase [Paraneptunicella aestuarii]
MKILSKLPEMPYYAVIFSSIKTEKLDGYNDTAEKMWQLAHEQEGFLGVDSAGGETHGEAGITVSYWRDLDSIKQWKMQSDHAIARKLGKEKWYQGYTLRVAKVEKQYDFSAD